MSSLSDELSRLNLQRVRFWTLHGGFDFGSSHPTKESSFLQFNDAYVDSASIPFTTQNWKINVLDPDHWPTELTPFKSAPRRHIITLVNSAEHVCWILSNNVPRYFSDALWQGYFWGVQTVARMHGGTVLHGAALSFNGKAVLLLGPPGVGKSSLSIMASIEIDSATLISDDRTELGLAKDGGIWVAGVSGRVRVGSELSEVAQRNGFKYLSRDIRVNLEHTGPVGGKVLNKDELRIPTSPKSPRFAPLSAVILLTGNISQEESRWNRIGDTRVVGGIAQKYEMEDSVEPLSDLEIWRLIASVPSYSLALGRSLRGGIEALTELFREELQNDGDR